MDSLGTPAGIANAGTTETFLGAGASVGSIVSRASIALNTGVSVGGDVTTAGGTTKQTGVTISGVTTEHANFGSDYTLSWPAPPLRTSRGNVALELGTTLTVSPGTYGNVSVKQGATLTLQSGVYLLDSIASFESGSNVRFDTGAGPITFYVKNGLISRGNLVDVAGGGSRVLVVLLGTASADIWSPFFGTLLAPYGSLHLAAVGLAEHVGSFFAKDIQADASATIKQLPFSGSSSTAGCQPLSASERAKAQSLERRSV